MKSKLTPKVAKTICAQLAKGSSVPGASALAGIDERVFYLWQKRGREAIAAEYDDDKPMPSIDRPFAAFSRAVEKARAVFNENRIALIAAAAEDTEELVVSLVRGEVVHHDGEPLTKTIRGSWQAAAWLLERKDPKHFGKQERIEHTGKDGGPIQLSQLDAALAKGAAEEEAALDGGGSLDA